MESRDAALLNQLRAGDATVAGPLMEGFADRVYRVAHGITGNAGDAEAVVRDVFLGLACSAAAVAAGLPLGAWLYRLAVDAALAIRRGRSSAGDASPPPPLPEYESSGHRRGARAALVADWSRLPDAALLSGDAREAAASIRRSARGCLAAGRGLQCEHFSRLEGLTHVRRQRFPSTDHPDRRGLRWRP